MAVFEKMGMEMGAIAPKRREMNGMGYVHMLFTMFFWPIFRNFLKIGHIRKNGYGDGCQIGRMRKKWVWKWVQLPRKEGQ